MNGHKGHAYDPYGLATYIAMKNLNIQATNLQLFIGRAIFRSEIAEAFYACIVDSTRQSFFLGLPRWLPNRLRRHVADHVPLAWGMKIQNLAWKGTPRHPRRKA